MASYQQKQRVYIHLGRNMFKHPEYKEIIKRIFIGQELTFMMLSSFETKTISQTGDDENVMGKVIKAKKSKKYL